MEFFFSIIILFLLFLLNKDKILTPRAINKKPKYKSKDFWALNDDGSKPQVREIDFDHLNNKILEFKKSEASAKQVVEEKHNPYFLNKRLFTPPEIKYLKVLQSAVGDQYWVMGKVRIADIFGVKKARTPKDYYYSFNRIKAKHFDYVLCDKDNYKPIAAIELDDSSHQRHDRIDRDKFVNELCEENKFLLIRVKISFSYNMEEVGRSINKRITDFYR